MDKTLLKAYIRVLVEEEVSKILPKLLNEAISEAKQLTEHKSVTPSTVSPIKPKIDRTKMAELLGISREGDTLRATGSPMMTSPSNDPGIREVEDAINRDYSETMKRLGL